MLHRNVPSKRLGQAVLKLDLSKSMLKEQQLQWCMIYVYNGIPQDLIQSSLLYYNFSMGTTFSILYRCQEHQ